MMVEQILVQVGERNAYFWRTQRGAELDLFVLHKGKRYGFEFKVSDAPQLTPSMRIAVKDLKLDYLWVLYPAKGEPYALACQRRFEMILFQPV